MLKNTIDLPGVSNSRELGAYPVGYKYIKKGVLLRTGGLNGAAPEALNILSEKYRVQTVVDFRMKAEQDRLPDPVVEGAENIAVSVIELEDYPDSGPAFFEEFTKPNADRMKLFELAYSSGVIGCDTYDLFLLGERGKTAYRRFFRTLLEVDDGAILWHCTDGKDRTGCAAMLLLSALGASRETIMEDYLLTNEFNAAILGAVQQKASALQMPPEKRDALIFMSGCVAERYMGHALDTLNKRYGSVTGYLRDELGVGAAELDLLKEKYLCDQVQK